MVTLSQIVLRDRRQFFTEKVQAPMMKALTILANRYPEPTIENCKHPNSLVWLRVWDRFLSMEDNPGRIGLWQAIKRVFIGKSVEVDPYYRDREQVFHELWLEEVLAGNWKPRSLDHPQDCWKVDPNIRTTGYELLKNCFYYPEFRESLKLMMAHPDKSEVKI